MSDDISKTELLGSITTAIQRINLRKAAILQRALDEGGPDLVMEVLDQIQELRDARFELIQRNLDTDNDEYQALAAAAKREAEAIGEDIEALESVAKVLGTIANVVNFMGRIFIRFGI
ncbi:MAG TPA: hypothetical protein VEA60_09090 [Allosphingosinicella sp.]|nr:hypothetical protein [Allosphingosinicella sp.]